jgi:hypothetical protein
VVLNAVVAGSATAALFALFSPSISDTVPIWLRLVPVVLYFVSFANPQTGFLLLAAFVPLGSLILEVTGVPQVYYTEATVLGVLGGAFVSALNRRSKALSRDQRLTSAGVAFATVVVASAAVRLATIQAGLPLRWSMIGNLATFIAREYFGPRPRDVAIVGDAALLLEGLALVWAVRLQVARRPEDAARIAWASIASATVAAAASLWHAVALALQTGSRSQFLKELLTSRVVVHVADVNTAGSYFAMVAVIALALSLFDQGPRQLWLTVAVVQFAALWKTGSRVAILAAIAFGVLVVHAVKKDDLQARRASRTTALMIMATLLLVAFVSENRLVSWDSIRTAARLRVEFATTTVRMIEHAPLFGIGVGRYYEASESFMPDSVRRFFVRENAHNNFLQIAGELGLVGIVAFAWFLTRLAIPIFRAMRARPDDYLLKGLGIGLAAFVATWLTSHPMLVPEAAYPFWILVGVAIGRAGPHVQASTKPGGVGGGYGRIRDVTIAATLLLTVPIRVRAEIRALDLPQAWFGFYFPEREGATAFRWASRRAAFFVAPGIRDITLPLRAIHIAPNLAPTVVSIAVNGDIVQSAILPTNNWAQIPLRLPVDASSVRYQRIDLVTNPVWAPSVVLSSRGDMRLLGVELGAVDGVTRTDNRTEP